MVSNILIVHCCGSFTICIYVDAESPQLTHFDVEDVLNSSLISFKRFNG